MAERVFTKDWFSKRRRQWRNQLEELRTGGVVRALEIGSYEGRSACWLAEYLAPDLRLECIDPFVSDEIEARFMQNTEALREQGLLSISKGLSINELACRIAEGREYDFIYVDGSHEGAIVLWDAVACFQLLRVGGKMCFDDYLWNRSHRHFPPKPAINAFLRLYGPYLEVTAKSYQVWVRKTKSALHR